MSMIDSIAAEFAHEAGITRRVLERAPEGQFGWKPHEKSMTVGRLSSHLAEIPQWLGVILNQDEFEVDPETYKPFEASSQSELLEKFESSVRDGEEAMKGVSDEHLVGLWKMKTGGKVTLEMPRVAVVRGFVLNHLIHHRGQLSVYLRLTGQSVPAIYGPSADEKG